MTEDKKKERLLWKKREVKTIKEVEAKRVNIGVQVDDETWRRLRALAIRQHKLTGELLDQAIIDYLEKHEKVR